jgi:hypothetical protein
MILFKLLLSYVFHINLCGVGDDGDTTTTTTTTTTTAAAVTATTNNSNNNVDGARLRLQRAYCSSPRRYMSVENDGVSVCT